MKKFFAYFMTLLLLLQLTACMPQTSSGEVEKTGDKKLKVVTSFYIPYEFLRKIAGKQIELSVLVQAGSEPHDWEPSSQNIKELLSADLFVYAGAGMEPWIKEVLSNMPSEKIKFLDLSSEVDLIQKEGEADPHTWLSPQEVMKQIHLIKDTLTELDPKNQMIYEENANLYQQQLEALDKAYKESVAQFHSRILLVPHKAFAYLCRAYGLEQEGIRGIFAHTEPSPKRIAELVKFAKENQVPVVFFESLISPKVAETIAQEAGIGVASLNPLEGGEDQEQLHYIEEMYKNLEILKTYYIKP